MKRLLPGLATLLIALVFFGQLTTPGAAQTPIATTNDAPVFAYYYIWFTPSSWNRAKTDVPLLGAYASTSESVIRQHVQWAKQAGIDGFIVSWKSTPALNASLATLVRVSEEEHFKLAINYESLDFWRHPLPVDKIVADLTEFVDTWGGHEVFDTYPTPLVVWAGTWKYDRTEIGKVTSTLGDQLIILASQKSVGSYEHIADLVSGNAYYWSSVNPDTFPDYPGKLQAMATSVHAHGGIWIAPAAPGFDARHLGGEKAVLRANGATLITELRAARASDPDMVGLISWNEFSENSHVEPSCIYGDSTLNTLASVLGGTIQHVNLPCNEAVLATAQANSDAQTATPEATSVASATAVSSPFDWDSSGPGGRARIGDRLAILVMLGCVVGLTVMCLMQVVKRATRTDLGDSPQGQRAKL